MEKVPEVYTEWYNTNSFATAIGLKEPIYWDKVE